MPLPLDGADRVLERLEVALRRATHAAGALVYTGALRRWHDAARERHRLAYETLMQLEFALEHEERPSALRLLALVARAKGLLAGLMLALILWQAVDNSDGLPLRRPGRSRGRRDEIELVDTLEPLAA